MQGKPASTPRTGTAAVLSMTTNALNEPGVGLLSATSEAAAPAANDQALVSAIAQGKPSATRELYQMVVPVIDRTLLRVLGGRDRDHEDLVQLSLEHVLRSVLEGRFRFECSLQQWAAVLSSRLAITELRRRGRTPAALTEPAELERRGADPHSLWHAERAAETRDLVRRALSCLRPERAQVLYLYEVEGFRLEEIAALMKASVAAVQSRLVRGRSQLAEQLRALSAADASTEGVRRER